MNLRLLKQRKSLGKTPSTVSRLQGPVYLTEDNSENNGVKSKSLDSVYYRVTKNNMDNSGQEYLLLNPCLSIIVIIDYK